MEAWERDASGSDERLRQIIEAAPNAMIMVSDRGHIVLANSEAEQLFGFTRDELLIMTVEQLMPEQFRERHPNHLASFFAAPVRRNMGGGRELLAQRKDGSQFPIELALNPITMGEDLYVLGSITDIDARLTAQEADNARREDAMRRMILDVIPFSILAVDRAGTITRANPAAAALLGYRQEDMVGSPLTMIDAEPRKDAIAGGSHGTAEAERLYRRKDGRLLPVSETVVDLEETDVLRGGFLVVAYDISKRIESRARVEYLATHDELTNLPNRTMLLQHLQSAIDVAALSGSHVVLVLLDLDHFKRVNDSLGHQIGDELLLQVSERLVARTRRGDLVGRLGGDEFVIVMSGVAGREQLRSRLDEIQDLLGPVELDGYQLDVTASMGAALYPRDGDSPAQLLKSADTAMYRAKAAGRDNTQWFEAEMLGEANEKLSLSTALRHGLGAGELFTVYQPQLSLSGGELVGFEALARWSSPTRGAVSPDLFIPVAEDGGMIRELGTWVLRTACADVASLQRELSRTLRIAVNVSPRELRGTAWLDETLATLDEFGLHASQLELEVTEGLLVEAHGEAVDLLTRIRKAGATVVVDDFGCGYSSLGYLRRLPIDKLKIDRSFIREITSDATEAPVVDAIIVMAHALGLVVVAEGVETTAQEAYLRERGCDEVQGYLYGRGVRRDAVAGEVRSYVSP